MGILDFFKNDSSKQNLKNNIEKQTDDIETQREGYLELIKTCVGDSKEDELVNFIRNLKNYNGDKDYMTTLNFVLAHLDENGIHFIMALDWKQEIRDLKWRISSSLKDNFNIYIDLPNPEKYGENKSVSFKNVFKDYDQAIRQKDFQLSFVDTNGDEYVIIVHKIKDEQLIKDAIKKIGYNCLDANSPKINNEI